MNFQKIKEQDQKNILNTYHRFDVCIESGRGATCKDVNGKTYIDFTSGIGVNSLGFAHPEWVKAVTGQAAKLAHISNLYYTIPDNELAKALCEQTGYGAVFFGNSGAEANEGAIKVARKYSFDKYGAGRSQIVTLVNSFHGRTVTTLAATGQDVFHQYFGPFTEGFRYAEANSMESVAAACGKDTCAVMLEFIQGEGGVVPLDEQFVRQLFAFCKERDILVIADEVQTGVGRTGKFLAAEHYGVRPDITTLAKGLGGGLPIGAILVEERLKPVMGYSSHGSTFGGNPVACAGANVVLRTVCNEKFLREVAAKGEKLRACISMCGDVAGITGKGMMLGIQLKKKTAADVANACLEKGLLVLTAKDRVRLLPPLTITDDELKKGLQILWDVLA